LEQHSQDLRAQLMRILGSKSLKLGTSLRGIYWTLRGQPGAPGETTPPDVPIAHDPGSEFLRLWDTAKRSVDGARRAAEATPSSPVVAPATSAPATHVQTEKPPPAVAPTPPPPLTVSPRQGGRVIALQAASLGNGGLERVVFDLAIGLKARGEKVIVVCVQSGGIFADELLQRGITVHEVNRDVSRFESVLRDEGVTDLFAHHSYFGYERAASLGVRLYDVVHNYYFWHRGSGNMIRRVADLSAGVVYVSAAVRSFHERLFGVAVNKGIVINNPVHIDGLIVPEKPQLQRLREKSSETIFLNVAQAFPSKAQPALITAFARALRKNRAMKLRIAGAAVKEEAARAVRARIEDEGVGNAVELLGHCDRRKMSKLYAEAHAFVLPSLYEGYSVSAIEAATYSLPLILTNVGGAEDLIAKSGCGILLPSATDDLAKLDPPAVEKLGLESENAATSALEKAFLTIAGERPQWTARGLAAHYDIRSLDDVIDAYLALMPATARASA
jgi:glycosyltransferase involved in cell wall biosynthesis